MLAETVEVIKHTAEHSETFWDLFYSIPHWEFELLLEFLTAVIFGKLIWGFVKKHIHKDDETLEAKIIKEVDRRFTELVEHMHDDVGLTHTPTEELGEELNYRSEQIAGRDDI